MARYRKIDTRIWNDERFALLSDDGKLVFLFLLTHPHLTSLGAMRATVPGLAAELRWPVERFREAFADLLTDAQRDGQPLVEHDDRACFIGLPKFLKYNSPENGNVVKSWGPLLDLLPECSHKTRLLSRVREHVQRLGGDFAAGWERVCPTLSEGFAKPFGNGMPNPEPEPEHKPDPKRRPPPPRNANKPERSEDWAAVEAELFELGLEAAGGTVELARKRDYTTARLREAIRVWRNHPEWGPGTIHEHVKQTRGNVATEKGWWPKPEAKRKQSPGETRLKTAYGPRLDLLSEPELRDLMERAGIPLSTIGHCRATTSLRDRLLAQLASEDTTQSGVAK